MAIKKWRQQLENAKKLFGNNRKNLHGLATILVGIYDDPAFSEDVKITDQFALADWLNAELKDEFQDVLYDFLQLRAVLLQFPKAADWEGRPIQELYLETAHAAETLPTAARTNPGYRDRANTAEEKVKDLTARNNYLEGQVKEQGEQITELRLENRTSRETILRLEGRIIELERLLGGKSSGSEAA